MSVAAGVSDSPITVREKLRGKIGQTKVKRYWPGKVTEWANDLEEDAELVMIKAPRSVAAQRADLDKAFPLKEESDFPAKDDPRLRRLAESRRDREEAVARHRQIRQAEIVSTREEEKRAAEAAELGEEEEDEEERRRRIREKFLHRQRENEEGIEEEEEEESESETDSEEAFGSIAMVKPVFVPKAERETKAEKEKLEAEEKAFQESVKKRLEDRKVETKLLLVEVIRQEVEIEKNREAEGDGGEIDTDDETNEAEEYEAWKVREIARIKRDREHREAMVKQKEDIEKLRIMTEEERREWGRKNLKSLVATKKKSKLWKFMQKYYHKGAFFQSGADDTADLSTPDDIFRRDFSAPTGEDKLNKTILPKVMQVKHFGRSGQTKWTHLVAEDTTQWDNPWTYNDPLRAKYNTKMAGMNRPISKPHGSKKHKDWEET